MQRQGVLWIVVLVLVASSAAAENLDALAHTTPEQRAAEQTRMMKSRLDLSADQVGQVQAVNLKYAKEMDPVLKGSGGVLERLKQARQIDHAKDTALQGVLSESQFQKYTAAKQEMRHELEQNLAKKVDAGGS
jgi:uncharacterized protein involved in outer membrane biogenesis